MDRYLTNSVQIPFAGDKIINGTTVDNLQSGGLLSDLKITKSGTVIAVDSDWNYFSTTSVVYVADNQIQVSNLKVFNNLQIGTPILVTQTTDKYFYVIEKDTTNSYIYLNAGDNYTYTSGSISAIAFSDKLNPSDFPQVFDFSTGMEIWGYDTTPGSWVDITSNFSGGSGLREASYSMNGSVVTVSYNVGTVTLPADLVTIVMTSPFRKRVQSQINVGTPTYLTAGTIGGVDVYISMIWGYLDESAFPGDPFNPYTLGVATSAAISIGSNFSSGSFGMRNTFVVAV